VEVEVKALAVELRALRADPSVLEPANGTMRDVTVTADFAFACGNAGCRVVGVTSSEGTAQDWKITGR
jgi:hypothetical protein